MQKQFLAELFIPQKITINVAEKKKTQKEAA